jgi:hypothetical protein
MTRRGLLGSVLGAIFAPFLPKVAQADRKVFHIDIPDDYVPKVVETFKTSHPETWWAPAGLNSGKIDAVTARVWGDKVLSPNPSALERVNLARLKLLQDKGVPIPVRVMEQTARLAEQEAIADWEKYFGPVTNS